MQRGSAAEEARERCLHVVGRKRGSGLQLANVALILGLELRERAHAVLLRDYVEQPPRKRHVLISQAAHGVAVPGLRASHHQPLGVG